MYECGHVVSTGLTLLISTPWGAILPYPKDSCQDIQKILIKGVFAEIIGVRGIHKRVANFFLPPAPKILKVISS